jgi:lysophospholipase L1-like esterase
LTRSGRWLPRSFIAAAGLLFALSVLEVGLRIVAAVDRNYWDDVSSLTPPPRGRDFTLGEIIRAHANDRIVYELRPGLQGRFLGQQLAINSLGMRAGERTLAKAPGTFRIIGLGDSVMFGWAVAEPDTYLAVLERELGSRFPNRRFETWNLAVPGYNTVQEVETFAEKVDRLAPDLVIIGWVGNDADLPNFLVRRPDPWSLERSFLSEAIERRIRWLTPRATSFGLFEVPPDEGSGRLLLRPAEIPERYRPLAGWDNMVAAFHRLAKMAKDRGIPAVALFDAGPRHLKEICAGDGFVIAESQHRVLRYESEHGVDRYSALRISRSDSHPNALGHQLIAQTLLEALLRAGTLQGLERAR